MKYNNIDSDFKHNPLVSIVLPTYNRENVLPHAIQSVLNQTYKNLELIIVDDNSQDNTSDVVNSINDPRIRYIRNEQNLKLPITLNKGFSLTKGELLTWTSDDNVYVPNAIEQMVSVMSTQNYKFVYADYYLFEKMDNNVKPIAPHRVHLPNKLQLEKNNYIGACFMYTREVYEEIGEYDPELFLVEDYDYFIRISKKFPIHHIPEALYYFRRDDNTLFYSRYCEVKAADILVRYKNKLLNNESAVKETAILIMANIESLKIFGFRWFYKAIKDISYRITSFYLKLTEFYLNSRVRKRVYNILNNYSSNTITFKEAKDALGEIMQQYAYIKPIKK